MMMMTGQPRTGSSGLTMDWTEIVSAMRTGCVVRMLLGSGFQNHFHDRMERKELEEERRAKERQLMEEGR